MNILLAAKHAELDAHNAKRIAQAARESNTHVVLDRPSSATAAGDERKLRGIPAIGRGVAGCIPGTSPHGVR